VVVHRLRDFLELKKTTTSLAVLFEAENGDYARMVSNINKNTTYVREALPVSS